MPRSPVIVSSRPLALDRVVAVITGEDVRTRAAEDHVVAEVAEDEVIAGAALEMIVAVVAVNRVEAVVAEQLVIEIQPVSVSSPAPPWNSSATPANVPSGVSRR